MCCVSAGVGYSIAVAKDGTGLGWGFGDDECLGLQLAEDQTTPREYKGLRLAVP